MSNALAWSPSRLGAPGAVLHLLDISTQALRDLGEIMTGLDRFYVKPIHLSIQD